MSEEHNHDFDYEAEFKEALKEASQELADDDLESFVLASFDGDQSKVTMHADQFHQETEMPMPQMLLATIIYNYSQRSGVEPLRIGQAATYAAEQIFKDSTEADFVRDFDDYLREQQ